MISRHLLRRCYPAMVRSSSAVGGEPIRKFEQELTAKIKLNGPMSVAHYMQEALTNPVKGYYTTKDKVLGSHGDFVTSPEISQMFGECIGIWLIHEWRKMGSARPFQLVELGPGHGTLMQDILRTIMKLVPNELANLSVHLVETSQTMRKVQQARLCGYYQQKPESGDDDSSDHQAISKQGPTVKWYSRVNDVPKDFTFFIANEFFDALPIHKFVKDAGCWQEILVDIDQSMVRSRQKTLATQYVINDEAFNDMEAVEISPKAGATIQTMSERIAQFGGAVLIADYGYSSDDEVKTRDTFRAFKAHQLHDPLQDAGQADLTADVDFDYLKRQSGSNTLTYGPVPQSQYLTQLGIQIRCNLLKDQNSKVAKDVDASLEMLISPDKMGSRFKFFSIFPKTMSPIHADYPPVGFHLKKHQHDQC